MKCPVCGAEFETERVTHEVSGLIVEKAYGVETRVVTETRESWMNRRPWVGGSIQAGYGGVGPEDFSPWTLHPTCSEKCAREYIWTMRKEHDAPGAEYRLVLMEPVYTPIHPWRSGRNE